MEEIVKHINDTNASYRTPNAGDAKNTDLFLDNEHYELFKNHGEQITVRFSKNNLTQAILFIASILPRKYDNSAVHKMIPFSKKFVIEQLELLDAYFVEDGINVDHKTQIWNARKDVPQKNGKIDNRFYFNGLLDDFSYRDANGLFKKAKFTIRNYLAGGYSDIHIRKGNDGIFDVWVTNVLEPYDDGKENGVINNELDYSTLLTSNTDFVTALRTKPFLLLAGISGTGKSQKVQELAFMTCPEGELRNEGGTTPGNYCLVEVKPNWHDSTELLGYYSALSGKYELTDFIRFAYKASQNKDVPFFLCLDEMNLAPVEQYFAEFLSVLETRKKVDDEIRTEYLLKKEKFSNCKLQEYILTEDKGVVTIDGKNYNMKDLYSKSDEKIITYLKEKGLTLPDNLFVIGTVNMDDTTHQFSRKVIDRAFTIEMNGGKMSEMFSPESKMLLEYRDEPIPLEAFKAEFVRAYEVLDDARFAKYKDVISNRIPALLGDSDGTAEADSINGILNETPFRVSYRVQNELVLYLSTLIERANFPETDQIEGLIGEATLAILLEKMLPRVQGEQKQLETQKGKSNVLKDLKTFVESHFKPEEDTDANSLYNQVLRKLKEMDDKLANYYTNFF
ncbi:MAG: hypothetical protein ILA06_05060 [Bacteroidaceae bacterium]|nr:hypothetical protein [Bacteroidaceae bacterium]